MSIITTYVENHPDSQQQNTFCGFEGPGKKLRLEFRRIKGSHTLRDVTENEWQQVLDHVNCRIMSKYSNSYFDSFVLSESSLFVYPYKFILKTCGTTTLLKCLKPMITLAKKLDLEINLVFYSRARLLFPKRQMKPHTSFEEEVEWLDRFFEGKGFVFGPTSDDHWHMYLCDMRTLEEKKTKTPEQTLEIMMFELDPEKMKQFWKTEENATYDAFKTTYDSGIASLLPWSLIDPYQFEPCGYSMNGLLGNAYWTIHITPEDHCSYVSFETNVSPKQLGKRKIGDLIRDVVKVFRPGRFVVAKFADDDTVKKEKFWSVPSCRKKFKELYRFEDGKSVKVATYQSWENYRKHKIKQIVSQQLDKYKHKIQQIQDEEQVENQEPVLITQEISVLAD
jgi:S-adenosylmethionine decarboxylase